VSGRKRLNGTFFGYYDNRQHASKNYLTPSRTSAIKCKSVNDVIMLMSKALAGFVLTHNGTNTKFAS
jgi:hypothetical protein